MSCNGTKVLACGTFSSRSSNFIAARIGLCRMCMGMDVPCITMDPLREVLNMAGLFFDFSYRSDHEI